jgi:hypothetical protein
MIPADEEDAFQKWVEAAPYWEGYEGKNYEECALGGSPSNVTFADPGTE